MSSQGYNADPIPRRSEKYYDVVSLSDIPLLRLPDTSAATQGPDVWDWMADVDEEVETASLLSFPNQPIKQSRHRDLERHSPPPELDPRRTGPTNASIRGLEDAGSDDETTERAVGKRVWVRRGALVPEGPLPLVSAAAPRARARELHPPKLHSAERMETPNVEPKHDHSIMNELMRKLKMLRLNRTAPGREMRMCQRCEEMGADSVKVEVGTGCKKCSIRSCEEKKSNGREGRESVTKEEVEVEAEKERRSEADRKVEQKKGSVWKRVIICS